MKKNIFKFISKVNKKVLPSYSKQQLDLQKATNLQKAIIGWKLWVTKKALNQS
ncbi:MAG: SsrA-binding protein [Gillisia sp.]